MLAKRISFFVLGVWILSLGVVLVLKSNLGTGAWDSVFVGFFNRFGLTFGSWVFIVSFFLMFINATILKEKPEWLSLAVVFVNGLAIDFWNELVLKKFSTTNVFFEVFLLVFGIYLVSLGVLIYLKGDISKAPVDGLMIALHKRFKLSFAQAKTVGEVSAFIIGFSIGGPIGVGTVVSMVLIGPCISLNEKILKKIM